MALTDTQLDEFALAPQEIEGDQGRFKNHSLSDLIKLADRAAGVSAVATAGSAWGCVRAARVVPPAAVGPSDE